jgi:hypothetical protein
MTKSRSKRRAVAATGCLTPEAGYAGAPDPKLSQSGALVPVSFAATATRAAPRFDQPRISGSAEKLCSAAPRRRGRRIEIVRLLGDQRLRGKN